ncbi:MAG: hypothetical protein L6Q92_11885 [Phycisphaerae bacterium]|nr:hypothetical protein [Phycisphaerae bacterium]
MCGDFWGILTLLLNNPFDPFSTLRLLLFPPNLLLYIGIAAYYSIANCFPQM